MVFWSIFAGVLAVAIAFGAYKMWGDMSRWRADVGGDPKPWDEPSSKYSH